METLPAVYSKPDLPVAVTEQLGQSVKALIESTPLSMITGVVACELLQWVKVADAVPAHREIHYYRGDDGRLYGEYIWIEAQPRRMLLSQALSTTMETAIIASTVLKSVSDAGAGIAPLLTTLFNLFKK